jgi:hypothetical protein
MATEHARSPDEQRSAAPAGHRDGGPAFGPLTEEFARLTHALLDTTSVTGALRRIVVTAVAVIPGADVASVTVRSENGTFHTPAATDEVAVALDQHQYDHGEGPCLEASRSDGPTVARSDDLSRERRWPRFGPAAVARGMARSCRPRCCPPSGSRGSRVR